MTKSSTILLLCLLATFSLRGQTTSNIAQPVSIGSNDPAASAMLDVQATDKGLLVPRMTTLQRNAIVSPAVGLLVFDTDENDFFFRTASAWVSMEAQALSFSGNTLNLSNGGNSVTFESGLTVAGSSVSAVDVSATNEIQTLSIAGNNLSISSGNTVVLPTNICSSDKAAFGTDTGADNALGIGTCPDNTARLLIKDTDTQEEKTGIKVNFTGQGTTRRGAHFRVENGSNTNDGIVLFSKGTNNATGIVDSVISGNDDTATGARFVVMDGANNVGINMKVENGSNTNDGIVLLSKGNNTATGIVDSVITTNVSSTVTGARLAAMNGKKNLGMNILADDGAVNAADGQNIGIRIDVKDNMNNDNSASPTARDIGLYVVAEDKTNDYAAYFDGNVGILGAATTATADASLRVAGGFDAEPGGGGHIQSGLSTENNIVMDGNEIMARNNGVVSTLFLNNDGGNVKIGNANNSLTGVGRMATTNNLEVEGTASKSSMGDWLANSDARLKKNIEPLNSRETLEKLLALRGVTYEWNDDKTGWQRPEGIQYGFTAQNVQEVFPTLVSEDNLGYLQTAYGTYDAMMVEAMREQQALIEKQEERLTKMEREMAEMKAMLQQAMGR